MAFGLKPALACSEQEYKDALEVKRVQEEWKKANETIGNYEKAKKSGSESEIDEARSKLQIKLVELSNIVDANSNRCGMHAQIEIKRRFDEINAKYPGKRGGLFKW